MPKISLFPGLLRTTFCLALYQLFQGLRFITAVSKNFCNILIVIEWSY